MHGDQQGRRRAERADGQVSELRRAIYDDDVDRSATSPRTLSRREKKSPICSLVATSCDPSFLRERTSGVSYSNSMSSIFPGTISRPGKFVGLINSAKDGAGRHTE